MNTNINIGVVGTGGISDLHLRSYEKNPSATIWAVCDMSAERAAKKAEQYGANKYYTDHKQLLADEEIDAISICTWNYSHAEIAIAALKAGKHVLVEKPLSVTLDQALEIEAAVLETGKQLQVGFIRRFDPNATKLKEMIDAKELGSIYYAKGTALRRKGNPGGWFADVSKSGGGPLIDIGIHVLDTCWYMMGRPKVKSINANTYHQLGDRSHIENLSSYQAADAANTESNVEDLANALIRFENGASLMIETSFSLHAQKDETSIQLFGERGGATLEPEFSIVSEKYNTIVNIAPQTDSGGLDIFKAFQNEIDHFIDSCKNNTTPMSSVHDGVEIMRMIHGIYESAKLKKEISYENSSTI